MGTPAYRHWCKGSPAHAAISSLILRTIRTSLTPAYRHWRKGSPAHAAISSLSSPKGMTSSDALAFGFFELPGSLGEQIEPTSLGYKAKHCGVREVIRDILPAESETVALAA